MRNQKFLIPHYNQSSNPLTLYICLQCKKGKLLCCGESDNVNVMVLNWIFCIFGSGAIKVDKKLSPDSICQIEIIK